tara:strand:+ start:528 stop:863 length:336 start_codon:yes stop_codon:yes gene_type:complete
MPIHENHFNKLRQLKIPKEQGISIPKNSLAHHVHKLETRHEEQLLRDLLYTLRLERNREQLRDGNIDALEELFSIVDRTHDDLNKPSTEDGLLINIFGEDKIILEDDDDSC